MASWVLVAMGTVSHSKTGGLAMVNVGERSVLLGSPAVESVLSDEELTLPQWGVQCSVVFVQWSSDVFRSSVLSVSQRLGGSVVVSWSQGSCTNRS